MQPFSARSWSVNVVSDPWADQPEKVVDIKVMAFPLNILELPKGFFDSYY